MGSLRDGDGNVAEYDSVLIDKKRLAKLEHAERLLDAIQDIVLSEKNSMLNPVQVWFNAQQSLITEDIDNGDYDKKD